MGLFFKTGAWLKYQLKAHYRSGHHVHSPYTYRLFTNVLFERWQYYSFHKIEGIRKKLTDTSDRKESDKQKYTQLLQRLCATNNAKTIIEIGRSDGISTMYLASNDTHSTVYSLSDKKPTDIFKLADYKNIHQHKSGELGTILGQIESLDMMYLRSSCGFKEIDTLFDMCKTKSRDGSIFIFDDIHSDRQTEERWKRILSSDSITLSIDLFAIGAVWFKKDLKRQHYTVKY